MWLATRNTNMDFYHTTLSRLSPVITHTLCDHPPERTTYYNWVGRFLPLRTAYHYWLVHRATLQPKSSDSTDAGEGEGGQKKAATNALLEIDSRRQQYTSNMLHARENTVTNYYSILIIVVGRKLHNQQQKQNDAIIELVSTLAITSLTLTVPPTPQSHNLYTHTHTILTTTRILNQQMAGHARTIDADDAAYCLAAYRSWLFATTQEQMRHLDQSVTTKTTTTTSKATSKTKISDQQVSSAPGGVVVVMVQSSPSPSPLSSLSSLSSTRSLAYNNSSSSSSSSEISPVSAANAILEQDTATPPPPTTLTTTTTAGQNPLFPAR